MPAGTTTAAAEDVYGTMSVEYEDATTPRRSAAVSCCRTPGTRRPGRGGDLVVPSALRHPAGRPQCDEANDYWDPDDKKVIMCYEDVDESEIFDDGDHPDVNATARRMVVASFYHELGHMAVDIYQLPATGRQEDVADQLAAYELLAPDDDGTIDPDYVQAAKDFATEWRIYAKRDGQPDKDALADPHTPNEARMYNILCWIYGSDPDSQGAMITEEGLPQDRADRCETEWKTLSNAWSELLAPHLEIARIPARGRMRRVPRAAAGRRHERITAREDLRGTVRRTRRARPHPPAGQHDRGRAGCRRAHRGQEDPRGGRRGLAAEHESDDELAGEISQLMYWTQVLMLARGLTLDDVYRKL